MAGNPSVVVERACAEGQFNLRLWAVCGCAAEIRGGNVCIAVCLCALEVALKQPRWWGWVDLSVQWGGCDVAVENGRGCRWCRGG